MKHHDPIAIDSIYEVINANKLTAIFYAGHSGIGSGMRDGGFKSKA